MVCKHTREETAAAVFKKLGFALDGWKKGPAPLLVQSPTVGWESIGMVKVRKLMI